MSTPLGLQYLPCHIIDQIIDYSLASFAYYSVNGKQAGISMLHCCQKWRARFMKRACSELTLECSGPSRTRFSKVEAPESVFKIGFPLWSSVIGTPTPSTFHLVKKLVVFSNSWDSIFDGSFLKFAELSHLNNKSLVSAQTLSIQIADYRSSIDISESKLALTVRNVQEFFHNVRDMVSENFSRIELSWRVAALPAGCEVLDKARNKAIEIILSNASQISIDEYSRSLLAADMDLQNVSNLTHLSYTYNSDHALLLDITRKNSSTLQELIVKEIPNLKVGFLLFDSNGSPIVYSSLKKLKLDHVVSWISRSNSAETNYTPISCGDFAHFPVLKSLFASEDYPFIYNVLSQGNDKLLESLRIPIAYDAEDHYDILRSFASTQFVNLKALEIDRETDYSAPSSQSDSQNGGREKDDPDAEIKRFFDTSLAKSTNIRHFSFKGSIAIDGFLSSSFFATSLQNLRALHLKSTLISLENSIRILQHCRVLETITGSVGFEEPMMNNVDTADLYRYMKQTYFPLNIVFSTLILRFHESITADYIAQFVVLLAICCPRFTFVKIQGRLKKYVSDKIRCKLEQAHDAEYTDDINRVLLRIN